MRGAAIIPFVAGLSVMSGVVLAQGADDPTPQLRDCSQIERAERPECMDKAAHVIAPPKEPKGDNWTISQTTSPVDYSPVATATTSSRDGSVESAMTLSIRCRDGRTDLVLAGSGISGRGRVYTISYRVNDGQPMQIAAAAPASGVGVAFGGDVVRLLQSLPDIGSLSIHLVPPTGAALDGLFSLVGLEAVRAKMVAACKWPHPVAKPNR
jgi:hypothetical protein